MRFGRIFSGVVAAVVFNASMALAGSGGPPVVIGKLGSKTYLMTPEMMTLYIFDMDSTGVSNCYGGCAEKWPPLLGEAGMELPSGFSLIKRNDGTLQITYRGKPLYLWFKDGKPGDMTGDGIKGVWHVAVPSRY